MENLDSFLKWANERMELEARQPAGDSEAWGAAKAFAEVIDRITGTDIATDSLYANVKLAEEKIEKPSTYSV